jgi:pyruvate-formate lyase-activating enzyme
MDDHAVRGFEGTQAKITPSLACNNDCRFCYNRAEKALTRPLTEERVLELVDEAAATSPAQLNLIGGEVTILPYFLRVLRHARERFGVISVNTNGRRFADAAFAYEAVTAGLGEVDVSLHGATAAVHDHVSRAPGAWGETTAGLRNLVTLAAELGRPRVSVTTIVLDWNVHELNALGALLRELGVTSWRIKWAYGALGGHAADDPSEYIVPYTRGVAHVRKALATHGAALRVIVHDIPVCLLGDLMAYSTVHEQHTVARYGADGLEEHVAVVERWGETSRVCDGCAARGRCCRPSPAYVGRYGDGELTPLTPADLEALAERSRVFRRDVEGSPRASNDGVRLQSTEAPALRGVFDRLDVAAREGRWDDARTLALEALALAPDDPQAARMQRVAEAHLLDRMASAAEARGEHGRARQIRRLLARHHQGG